MSAYRILRGSYRSRFGNVVPLTSGTEVLRLRLRLGVLPLFASQRLFPRLGELRRAHPELHLDIDTAGHGIARLGEGLDAVIALAREIDPVLYARRLDRNSVYVIGARSLVEGADAVTEPAHPRHPVASALTQIVYSIP